MCVTDAIRFSDNVADCFLACLRMMTAAPFHLSGITVLGPMTTDLQTIYQSESDPTRPLTLILTRTCGPRFANRLAPLFNLFLLFRVPLLFDDVHVSSGMHRCSRRLKLCLSRSVVCPLSWAGLWLGSGLPVAMATERRRVIDGASAM